MSKRDDLHKFRPLDEREPIGMNVQNEWRQQIEEATERYLDLLGKHHPERATPDTKAGTERPRSIAAPTAPHHLAQTGLMA
ncbi:MAG: hypothetical protein IT537_08495 [Hyphomicrobiales bacterium]|nr:hypothetical protein [Hyphomicrobiales bacterium]